jgi:hypothetical protein
MTRRPKSHQTRSVTNDLLDSSPESLNWSDVYVANRSSVNAMTSAADLIEKAIRQLETERDAAVSDANQQIEVLRVTLSQLRGTPATGAVASPQTTSGDARFRGARSVRAILTDLAERCTPDAFSIKDALTALASEGNNAQAASVSSILTRMKAEGVIEPGPRRGTYRKATGSHVVIPTGVHAVGAAPTTQGELQDLARYASSVPE